MKTEIAKAGSLLMVTQGEYSSYSVIGFFVILREFNPLKMRDEFLKDNHVCLEERIRFGDAFLSHLIREGLLLEIEHGCLSFPEYPSSNTMDFTPVSGDDNT